MQVIESILADAAQIAALRRDIHAHPELCFEEKRTSDLIAEQLTAWGIPIHRGMYCELNPLSRRKSESAWSSCWASMPMSSPEYLE